MLLPVLGIVHLRPRAWNSMELLHSIFSEYDDLDESLCYYQSLSLNMLFCISLKTQRIPKFHCSDLSGAER